MMTIVATQVFQPTASPASTHPSNTATTGFTYAYVETRDGEATVRSHVKTVNAMIDPKTMRYASARTDRRLKAATCMVSPLANAATSKSTPPATICIAAVSIVDE